MAARDTDLDNLEAVATDDVEALDDFDAEFDDPMEVDDEDDDLDAADADAFDADEDADEALEDELDPDADLDPAEELPSGDGPEEGQSDVAAEPSVDLDAFEEIEDETLVRAVADDDEVEGLREGEFICRSCYMAKRESALADPDRMLCRDCV